MALVSFQSVKVGDLRTPIELQRFEYGIDDYGFQQLKWTTYAKPRAKVEFDDRLIRQRVKDDGIDVTSVKVFTIRYIPKISPKDRIIYRDDVYEIYATQNLGERDRFVRVWGRIIEPTS